MRVNCTLPNARITLFHFYLNIPLFFRPESCSLFFFSFWWNCGVFEKRTHSFNRILEPKFSQKNLVFHQKTGHSEINGKFRRKTKATVSIAVHNIKTVSRQRKRVQFLLCELELIRFILVVSNCTQSNAHLQNGIFLMVVKAAHKKKNLKKKKKWRKMNLTGARNVWC